MKKIAILGVIILCLFTTSCSVLDDLTGSSKNPDEVYAELSSLISNPSKSTDMDGEVSFVGYIDSEPFEQTFKDEGDKVYTYQAVYICRNMKEPIFIDVTDIKDRLPEESYAKITGKVAGSVYWIEDNKQKEVVDFKVSKIEPFTISEEEPNTENKLELKSGSYSGTFEFVGAHRSKDSFGDVVVLYFNFTNTAPDSNIKFNGANNLLNSADIYYGDELTSATVFEPKELYSGALKASDLNAYTYSGKTQMYYKVLKTEKKVDPGESMCVEIYNDEFAFTNHIGIFVAANLAEMTE